MIYPIKFLLRHLKVFVASFLFMFLFCGVMAFCGNKLFFINHSSSAPQGVYVINLSQVLSYGDYCVVRLPRSVGIMKSGTSLLKKIQGLPGDKFLVGCQDLYIHGIFYPFFDDSRLPHLSPGSYLVPEHSFLFLNDPFDSFDSRYIGPVQQNYIVSKVSLLIPFEPVYRIGGWLYEKLN